MANEACNSIVVETVAPGWNVLKVSADITIATANTPVASSDIPLPRLMKAIIPLGVNVEHATGCGTGNVQLLDSSNAATLNVANQVLDSVKILANCTATGAVRATATLLVQEL